MLRITRKGYATQLMAVNVPKDSGRQVALFLTPARQDGAAIRASWYVYELEERLVRSNALWDKFHTRDDLKKHPNTSLCQIAASFGGGIPRADHSNCIASVNGGRECVSLWALEPDDLDMLEVHVTKPPRKRVASMASGGGGGGGFKFDTQETPSRLLKEACGGGALVAWLR